MSIGKRMLLEELEAFEEPSDEELFEEALAREDAHDRMHEAVLAARKHTVSALPSALCCAHCGGDYLHRTRTCHYLRPQEDSAAGTVIVTTPGGSYTTQGASMADNPSSRRSGLTIEFFCELCGKLSMLSLAQHKGRTEVKWTALRDSWPLCD